MDREKLAAVIVALNKVEVHGKDDLARMLGCIQQLEALYAQVSEGCRAE